MTKFRFDINALRALAVTAVVGYHYNVNFVPGGFVGVDIFFVISGYLMTDIIVSRLQNDRFNLFRFYYDRVKRIVPGLLGLCFALLVFGYFILDPIHYNTLSYNSIAAVLFYSNILFNESQGYFAPEYNTKMLLHTWSLSVEWQFYMIYPILLMGLSKLASTRRQMTTVLAVVVCVSLALCIYYSAKDQPTAFYLLPQRAWEMAAGGIVALNFKTGAPKYSAWLLSAGLLLIGVSIFYFDKTMVWPSYWAVAPVAGNQPFSSSRRISRPPGRLETASCKSSANGPRLDLSVKALADRRDVRLFQFHADDGEPRARPPRRSRDSHVDGRRVALGREKAGGAPSSACRNAKPGMDDWRDRSRLRGHFGFRPRRRYDKGLRQPDAGGRQGGRGL